MNFPVRPGAGTRDSGAFVRRVSVTESGALSANFACHPGDRSLHLSLTSTDGTDGGVCAVVMTRDAVCPLATTLGGGAVSTLAAPTMAAPTMAARTKPAPTMAATDAAATDAAATTHHRPRTAFAPHRSDIGCTSDIFIATHQSETSRRTPGDDSGFRPQGGAGLQDRLSTGRV